MVDTIQYFLVRGTRVAIFLFCMLSFSVGIDIVCAEDAGSLRKTSFNRDVRPFLSNTCFQCHGPDSKTREAGLRLDEAASAKADLGGYVAIADGKPESSEAMLRIMSDDPDKKMPPPESGLKLTDEEKEAFRRWIEQGAVFEQHWAFLPITRPAIPNSSQAILPIDVLIQQRLAESGFEPSPVASPETLIRRVTLDLTGLPPTIEELDHYLADVEQRGIDPAYESVVDGLLKSPRFGERMAWPWMEAARYADTDGYQNDGHRDMWRWRDWVIDAINRGMPFDQFTIEQLAGDLLPKPTHQQLIATAFNRNNRYNSEEGIPIEEFLLENAIDRVDTTATVWMGLTVGCARCHDHKFDAITQKEYYQLVDYFNDVAESGRAIKAGNSEPWIKTPIEEQSVKLASFDARVQRAEKAIVKAEALLAEGQSAWEQSIKINAPVLSNGLDSYFGFDADDDKVATGKGNPELQRGIQGNAAIADGKNSFAIGKIPGLIGNGRFSVSFWMNPSDTDLGPILSNETDGTNRAGILIEFIEGHLRWNINTRWISGVSTVETVRTFASDEWVHIALTNDGTQRAEGMLMYVNGKQEEVSVIRNTNSNVAGRDSGAAMSVGYSKHVGFWKGQIDELRFYTSRTLAADEVELLAVQETLLEIALISHDKRSSRQSKLMRIAYLEQAAPEARGKLWSDLNEAIDKRTAYWDSLPTTMVMKDIPVGRPSYVRIRGVYDALGEKVESGVPAILPSLRNDAKNSRLEFARWLVRSDHPLTARVVVNRFWQMLFGTGLVKTTEDFGAQGELPSHPELLDWLAAEFVANQWDLKTLLKTIVTSHTYRQSSTIRPELVQIDPDNRLLARAPRLRLPGNVLRDQALFVSGLLVEKQGGPSVFPYQPAKLWEEASNAKYKVGKGQDLYRRSLYTYWKRTLAPPTMSVLDTADRESCSVKPKSTNTPLQALTLLNDVTFVEAARKLAERMLIVGGESDQERIVFAFRTVTARRPTLAEVDVLSRALANYRHEFKMDPPKAQSTLVVGDSISNSNLESVDLAAATALANVLLNLEEVTTRE